MDLSDLWAVDAPALQAFEDAQAVGTALAVVKLRLERLADVTAANALGMDLQLADLAEDVAAIETTHAAALKRLREFAKRTKDVFGWAAAQFVYRDLPETVQRVTTRIEALAAIAGTVQTNEERRLAVEQWRTPQEPTNGQG